jgi:hypothetical protein
MHNRIQGGFQMHDIDRTQYEYYGAPMHEYGEGGFESTYGETPLGEIFQEASYEGPSYESYEYGTAGELNEEELMELAAELLEITNENEMEQFLGNIFRRVGKFVGGVANNVAPQLRGILKGVVSQALPMLKQAAGAALPVLGGALGTAFGGPAGGMIGSKLASAAGNMFGLEFEGLSQEDREFEGAKQVVKLAESAIKQAAQAGPNAGTQALRDAMTAAANQFMPGLLRPRDPAAAPGATPAPPTGGQHRHRSRGTWVRMGHRIVLYGI